MMTCIELQINRIYINTELQNYRITEIHFMYTNPHNCISFQQMTKTKPSSTKRRMKCKLNPLTFKKMVTQCLQDIYGEDHRYHFQQPGLNRLQEAAEQYVEVMWNGIRDITRYRGRPRVLPRDVREWKRVSSFNILYNRRNSWSKVSLCSIFNSLPKTSKV